jgi:hypothetical protein
MISDPHELYSFLAKPGIESTNLLLVYSDDEIVTNLRHRNKVIGAYVTDGARLGLYAYLDSLQERTL